LTTIEKRLAPAGYQQAVTGRTLSGYAVLYNVEARIGDMTESFAPGSMTKTLANRQPGRDIVALVDHDLSSLLGRVSSGTLKLTEDQRGVRFDIDIPRSALGDEILALQARGDLGGVSFAFRATDQSFDGDKRVVKEAELYEISIIKAFSAYPNGDTLSVRSLHQQAANDLRRQLYTHYLGGAR
jgi:HK97 family phage prohead protease